MKNQQPKSPGHTPHALRKSERSSLRLVAWETTRNCNLACVHCRASATMGPHEGELGTAAALLVEAGEASRAVALYERMKAEGRPLPAWVDALYESGAENLYREEDVQGGVPYFAVDLSGDTEG